MRRRLTANLDVERSRDGSFRDPREDVMCVGKRAGGWIVRLKFAVGCEKPQQAMTAESRRVNPTAGTPREHACKNGFLVV